MAKAQGSPRRACISRKPPRRESRMFPLDLYARVRFSCNFCTRDRGCSAHPAFPAPFDKRGRDVNGQTSGDMRREIAKVCLICGLWKVSNLASEISHPSSLRSQGPIRCGFSIALRHQTPSSNHNRWWLWVPAPRAQLRTRQGRRLPGERRRHDTLLLTHISLIVIPSVINPV